jgi:hypothetical protein
MLERGQAVLSTARKPVGKVSRAIGGKEAYRQGKRRDNTVACR